VAEQQREPDKPSRAYTRDTAKKQKPAEAGFFWPFRSPFECRPGNGRSSWSWALPALQSGCRL